MNTWPRSACYPPATSRKCREPRRIGAWLGLIAGLRVAAVVASTNLPPEGKSMSKVLPPPQTKGTVSVEESLARRRSVRKFRADALTAEQIGQLLWAAQGVTEPQRGLRTAPSAGATFPLETYAVTSEGVFRYQPQLHALAEIRRGDVRADLGRAALEQAWMRTAPLIVVLAAVPERTTRRYGTRGTMYVHMEAGHAAQNVHLQAVALGLDSVPVGAFRDAEVAEVLGLPKGQVPLYLVPVGRAAP